MAVYRPNPKFRKSERIYDGNMIPSLPPGVKLPSVTTILGVIGKPALVPWASREERRMVMQAAADLHEAMRSCHPEQMTRMAYLTTLETRIGHTKASEKLLAKAGDIGTEIHSLIEWESRNRMGQEPGPRPKGRPESLAAYAKWERWADAVNLRPKYLEPAVYSLKFGYAGRSDMLGTISVHGVDWYILADYKSGKAVYTESFLQNVAYQVAIAEMGHQVPEGGIIVRVPKTGKDPDPEVVEVPPRNMVFPLFMAALRLYKGLRKLETEDAPQRLLAAAPDPPSPSKDGDASGVALF